MCKNIVKQNLTAVGKYIVLISWKNEERIAIIYSLFMTFIYYFLHAFPYTYICYIWVQLLPSWFPELNRIIYAFFNYFYVCKSRSRKLFYVTRIIIYVHLYTFILQKLSRTNLRNFFLTTCKTLPVFPSVQTLTSF